MKAHAKRLATLAEVTGKSMKLDGGLSLIDILKIRACFLADDSLYTKHCLAEMASEESGRIFEEDIETVMETGEIIRQYPDDRPYPSVLISGKTAKSRYLHVVCAYNERDDTVYLVTVYQPDPALWIENRTRRR